MSKWELQIQEAIEEDWNFIEPWATLSRAPDDECLVGLLDGQIIAYVQWYELDPFVIVLSRLEVHWDYKRCGYGRQLVEYFRADGGIQSMIALDVIVDTVAFWEKLGFSREKDQEDYENHYSWSRVEKT